MTLDILSVNDQPVHVFVQVNASNLLLIGYLLPFIHLEQSDIPIE